MKAHLATELFPIMGEAELAELARDIAEHGLQVPIVTYEGMILDGRNRWAACEMAGVSPRTREWQGMGSPEEWVISLNLHRRHLSDDQRAVVARRWQEYRIKIAPPVHILDTSSKVMQGDPSNTRNDAMRLFKVPVKQLTAMAQTTGQFGATCRHFRWT